MAKLTKSAKEVRGRKIEAVRVKTAKSRSKSSAKWLNRQLNDPYVTEAKRQGYRSRAAFKLIQLDERFHFLGKGKRIVDLGCAPGGWTQVAVMRNKGAGKVVGVDILETEPVAGATLIQQDFTEPEAAERLKELLDGEADIVMSDMAANTIGHQQTDHLRTIALVEIAYEFAKEVLAEGGIFITKVFKGGMENTLLADVKKNFTKVAHAKPDASREGSPEEYLVALGYKKMCIMGAVHEVCEADEVSVDEENRIATTPAYMLAKSIKEINRGAHNLVKEIIKMI